jgi:hypothetical protein
VTRADLHPLIEACRTMIAAHEAAPAELIFLTSNERAALTRLYVETCRAFDARMNEVAAA